jgi:hypothetical protein
VYARRRPRHLGAINKTAKRTQCCERKPRHTHCRKLRRPSFSHPGRQLPARAIRVFDDKMGATPKLRPAYDTDPLPRARMVAIMGQNVEGLFLGKYPAGSTGLGKSWLAWALGHKDYRDNRSVFYQRVPKLFAELALARGSSAWARPVFRRTVAGHRGR